MAFTVQSAQPKGVLLLNLGSPDSPEPEAVGRYLTQFLMDERVIDKPKLLRRLLVSGLIVPRRKHESAAAYRTVWGPDGSPLVAISRRVRDRLSERLRIPVALGMRYGNPSTEAGLSELFELSGGALREVFVVPLYPHYAMSSYETAVEEVKRVVALRAPQLKTTFRPPFYADPDYAGALVATAREYLDRPYDKLLFSYHGLPERHMRKADPTGKHCLATPNCCDPAPAGSCPAHATCYRHQCMETTRAFVARAGIPEGKYAVSFQSRLGREPWLKPYTDLELERFAKEGVERMLVICPAFVSDCLETIEEIGGRGKETFVGAGGKSLELIPCMNDRPEWIDVLAKWCEAFAEGRA